MSQYDPAGDVPVTPWYLKPSVLIAWGALVAILLAVVIWGIVELASSDSGQSTPTTTSTITTASLAPAPVTTEPTTTTTTTAPTTTDTTQPATPSEATQAPTTTEPDGGFRRPHLPPQFTLPPLPSGIELPHKH